MRKIAIIFISTFALMSFIPASGPVHAWSLFPESIVCKDKAENSSTCVETQKQIDENPAARLLGQAADIIALIAGIIAVVMIVIAGFQLVTSGGNSEQVTKARGRILGAIAGLIIIALAWTIIRLVTDRVLK